jgi:hypothetical protein
VDGGASLSLLKSHNDVLVYHICDPIELAPPKPAAYAITNGQQDLILDTRINSINQAYANYCEQKQNKLQEQCKLKRMQYTQVTANMDLTQLVRRTFPRRTRG